MIMLGCYWRGHDWTPWENMDHAFCDKPYQVRWCRRCDEMERKV